MDPLRVLAWLLPFWVCCQLGLRGPRGCGGGSVSVFAHGGHRWAVAAVAQRPMVRRATVLALVLMTVMAMRQVPVWKNEATLWRAAIERAPSGYAKGALARWLEDQGLDRDAAFWYHQAVIQPPRPFTKAASM